MDIPSGGLDERILRLLLERGSSTTADLKRWLRLPEARLDTLLKALERSGVVAVERLPHATFVSLRRAGLHFVGIRRGQKHPVRRSRERGGREPDSMFR